MLSVEKISAFIFFFSTYQSEVKSKDIEVKKQEDEIKFLKGKAEQAQEKFSSEREYSKEGKLEEFAIQFGISLQQLDSLRKYYERLIVLLARTITKTILLLMKVILWQLSKKCWKRELVLLIFKKSVVSVKNWLRCVSS
ncbi:hypothetical protein GvMRE_IIg379 [endosymbiont GvMRE of Glomus versiforme]|nr:hypothetical protein GvMRE_IIg379 [endosymbiont GvMRE of Glomus versiforme]